jgi:glycosyltransferase involved in cell wall biosynthesis
VDEQRRTRVLWLIKGLGPGGAERLLVAAAAAHDRDRFDIEVAYLVGWKNHLAPELEQLGVRCFPLGLANELDLRWVLRLRRLLRARRYDVLHVHSPYAAAFSRLAVRTLPRRDRPRLVTTEHSPASFSNRATRVANNVTAPLDDATIAVSDETRAAMPSWQRRRAETLVHGVVVDELRRLLGARAAVRAELGIPDDVFVFGTVANYHPKKDWACLLHAARKLADDGRPIRFVAVGQGRLEAEVTALHRELRLGGVVTLTGYRADAVRVMAGCDAFVLASKWEGLPVALMEACALGLPIVASAVGGIPEHFADHVDALLVPPEDVDQLVDALTRVASDAELRERLAAGSAQRAADFDIRRTVARIEAVYDEVLQR